MTSWFIKILLMGEKKIREMWQDIQSRKTVISLIQLALGLIWYSLKKNAGIFQIFIALILHQSKPRNQFKQFVSTYFLFVHLLWHWFLTAINHSYIHTFCWMNTFMTHWKIFRICPKDVSLQLTLTGRHWGSGSCYIAFC